MEKENSSAFYNMIWKALGSGAQYLGLYLGVSAVCSNLAQYINSQRFFTRESNITEIINGPYTGTAIFGALLFITGYSIKDFIKQRQITANNHNLEEIIELKLDSAMDSVKNRMERNLEEQRAFISAYTKALENNTSERMHSNHK